MFLLNPGTIMKSISCYKDHFSHFVWMSILLFMSNIAYGQPVARFTATTISGCAPILVNFSDQSTGNPTEWKWDLGNGTLSNLQNPSVTYFNPGLYTVKLTVKSAAGSDSITKLNYITVYGPPNVNFTASQTSSCGTLAVNFTDQTTSTTGNINLWQWDFGDGILSASANPSHTYDRIGNYNVSLKVGNSNGCVANLLKTAFIKVNGVKAIFTSVVGNKCTPTKISFQNASTGNGAVLYKWFFGNGDSSTLASPVYTYAAGGNYTVKLFVKNQHGCIDSVTRDIIVGVPVSAAFAADITSACKPPVAIRFTNQVLSGNTYSWRFGDSLTSTVSNPTFVFRDTGTYTVNLIVKNSNGCVDSVKRNNYIRTQKPFVSIDNLPDSGCAPLVKQLMVTSTGRDSVVSYRWRFSDGATSTLVSPEHSFITPGYHAVSLIVEDVLGCRDTITKNNAIRITSKPVANFSADILNTCANKEISFTSLASPGVNQWFWDFGDESQAAEQHPKHVYTDTGFMSVQLIVLNGGCADTIRKERYIYTKPSVSKFTYNFSCAAPAAFTFNNFSIGAERWLWEFGDGTTSTQLNPVHNYIDTGTFRASLTTYNNSFGCSFYQSKLVKVVKVKSNFFAADSVQCKGNVTKFTAVLQSGQVTRFIWDFGDGEFENVPGNTITHQYKQPGTYTVRLITISLTNCRDTVTKTAYIRINGPTAKFATLVAGACANQSVVFSDSSRINAGGAIQSWQWNFGDGQIDTLFAPPFIHTYHNNGTYTVSLKVTDDKGCADSFKLATSFVIRKLNPTFWTADTSSCTTMTVGFVSPVTPADVSFKWYFGDGGTSTLHYPNHVYTTEGSYTVKLVLSTTHGCSDSNIIANYINVRNPVARFTMSDSFRTCPPLVIQFTNSSLNAIDEVWDFGDGSSTNTHNPSHFYSYPGVYNATLTVKSRGGCQSQMRRQIIVKGPKANLSYDPLNICNPQVANFKASRTVDVVSYVWDFNDGTTLSGRDTTVRHTYTSAGKYVPKIMLEDEAGCKVPVNGIDTILMVGVKAGMNFTSSPVCGNTPVSFANSTTSNEPVAAYRWNFGDAFSENGASPVHQYATAGSFFPSVVVTTRSGCVDSFMSPVPVRVSVLPNASMQVPANGCTPLTSTFTALGDTTITNWHWNFGNGDTSVLQNPPAQFYRAAGIFNVTLKVTNAAGCSKEIIKTIEAYALPVLKISGDSSICKGQATRLTASGASTYSWFPVGALSCSSCASPLANPLVNTVYTITATDSNGCSKRDSVTVKVQLPLSVNFAAQEKVCAGGSVKLNTAAPVAVYKWSPATGLSDATVASPVATPAASTQYRVIVIDSEGCFTDTGFVTVNVNALPTVDAGEDKTITLGSPVDLVPVVSADVVMANWSPTSGEFRNSDFAITVRPLINMDYKVEVKNAAGCTASDRVHVTVSNNSAVVADVFVPNTFSPNGDGSNDVFYPRAAGSVKIKRLKIFNRAGEAVYDKANFYTNDVSVGWNGTYKGSGLEADVFMYAIEFVGADGKLETRSGNIALLR